MRRQYGSFAGVLLLVFLFASAVHADTLPKSGDPAFDRVVELVMDKFYDTKALPRFEAAVRETVRSPASPDASNALSSPSGPAIDHVLASLGASHTGHFTAGQLDYYELADIFRYNYRDELRRLFPPDGKITYPGIAIATEAIEGKRFVTDVYDGGPAAKAGVEAGDEILSADGAPFEEINSFRGKVGRAVRLELRREASGPPIAVDVPVAELQPSETLLAGIANSAHIVEQNGKKIGYLHIWSYAAGDVDETLDRALTGPLKDADALVVDLRCRWGGAPPDAAEIFLGGTPPFRFIERDGQGELSNVRWHRPVVAIIDEGTRSGLEVFAYALKVKGIPLVGTKTAGNLLGGRGYMLPDGTLLELAVADVEVDGKRLEGIGVAPDVAVPFDIRYAAGRDPQLDAAFERALLLITDG
jgi:carboxyl-terminal processing protease